MNDKLPEGVTQDGDKMTVTIPYTPRPHQQLFHDSFKRFNVLVCHRRFGKSVFAVNEIIRKAMQCQNPNPQYAYVSPTIKQAKRNVWKYLQDFCKYIPYTKFNQAELTVTFPNGAKIYILGAENYNDVRGMYLDGVVVDEVAQMPGEMWSTVLRPALSDRLGWALFIGTPEGDNNFKYMYDQALDKEDWFTALIKASDTNYVAQKELDAALEDMGPDLYAQEFECSWTAAIKGAYYAELISKIDDAGQLDDVIWDPALPVTTAWDLGLKDKTCIWFAQTKGNTVYIIDYYEGEGLFIPDYIKVVKDKPYLYKEHLIPHDAVQTRVDQPNSALKQMKDHGLKCTVVPKTMSILDDINAVRTMLPRCYFDRKKCELGLKALIHYRTEYDSVRGIYKEKPRHDWSSHASDAFRYLAVGLKTTDKKKIPPVVNRASYDPFGSQIVNQEWDPLTL